MSIFQGFIPGSGKGAITSQMTARLGYDAGATTGLSLTRDQYHGVIYNLMATFDPLLQLIPSVQVQDHTFIVRHRDKGIIGEPLSYNEEFATTGRIPTYGQTSYTVAQSHVRVRQDRFAAAAANNLTGNIQPWDVMLYELATAMARTSAIELYNGPGTDADDDDAEDRVEGLISLAEKQAVGKGLFYMTKHGSPHAEPASGAAQTVLNYVISDTTRKTALLTLSENITRVINFGINAGVEYDFIVTDLDTVTKIRHLLGTYANGTAEYVSIFGQQVLNGIGASGVSPIPIIASSYFPEKPFQSEGVGLTSAQAAVASNYNADTGQVTATGTVTDPYTRALLFVKTEGPAQTNFSNQGGIFRAYVDTQPLGYPGLPDSEFINNGLGVGIASPSAGGNYRHVVGIWNEQIALGNRNALAILGGFTFNRESTQATEVQVDTAYDPTNT